jgi:tetratricopeptide (TPR) repeat protein
MSHPVKPAKARERRTAVETAAPPFDPRKWMLAGLLSVITLAAYINSFSLSLAFDAVVIVAKDTRIREATLDNVRLIFSSDYWWPNPTDVLYRPVTILSYLFNYSVLGGRDEAAGYHLVNFLLHVLNVLLVFSLCRKLFRKEMPAFFAAALWAVHPIGTEAVTNVAGRADLLAATGVLGGLALYIRVRDVGGRRAVLGALGLFGLTVFGSFSKENGAVLPGLMLLWDTLDLDALRRSWKRRLPFYGAAAAALLLLFWTRHAIFAPRPWPLTPFLDNPLLMTDFWTARFTAIKALGIDLWLMLCPLALSFDRSYRQIAMSRVGDLWAWCALLAIAAILTLAMVRYRRDRTIFFAAGFLGIALLPTSNLLVLIGSILAERFLYLPSIGFAIAVTALAFRLKEESTARMVLTVILVLFALRTFVRNFDWKDNLTLLTADVNVSSESYRPHDLLGRTLYVRDANANLDRSIQEGEATARIVADLPLQYLPVDALRHLGLYYVTKGDRMAPVSAEQGRVWYQKALATLLRARAASETQEAIFDREQLAHGRPLGQRVALPAAYETLAAVQSRLGLHADAIETLRHVIGMNPAELEFYRSLSREYFAVGDTPHAAEAWIEKLFLEGQKQETLYGVRETFAKMPGGECATSQNGAALTLNLACPAVRQRVCPALEDLAQAFTDSRQPARALEQRKKAQQFGCPAR